MIKACKNCGKEFENFNGRQLHCSKECAVKYKRKIYIERQKQNGYLKEKITYICKNCDKEYHPKNVDRKTFCCRECAYEFKSKISVEKKKILDKLHNEKLNKLCPLCGKTFKAKKESAVYCSDECRKEKNRRYAIQHGIDNFIPKQIICRECGKKFTTEYRKPRTVFCSDKCRNKNAKRVSKIIRRQKIKTNGKINKDISLVKLIERDRSICKICGKKIDNKDYIYDELNNFIAGKYYPSIDHMIPLSKGGTHIWNNVQLAHRYCNTLKNDKYIEKQSGQLAMF